MRILLADDEVNFVQSLAAILKGEGYVVDVLFDGQSAYEYAIDNEYDLLVLDIGMPGLNGVEVCRQLRSEGYSGPILMLTARDTTADTIAGLDSGADDYVVKPFAVEELLARIRSQIRRSSGQPQSRIDVYDLSLDANSRVVTRQGKEIELSAKEYALLEFLLRHRGHIISRQQILDHVWGADIDPFSNIVEVYIGVERSGTYCLIVSSFIRSGSTKIFSLNSACRSANLLNSSLNTIS